MQTTGNPEMNELQKVSGTSIELESAQKSEYSDRLRAAVLLSHPIQYFAPLMRKLGERPDLDLTVFYCSDHGLTESFDPQFGVSFKWDIPLLDGYKSVFLPNYGKGGVSKFQGLINPGIISALWKGKYDALLVFGHNHVTKWFSFMAAPLVGTGLVMRNDSHIMPSSRPLPFRIAKQFVLSSLMRSLSSCVSIGELNRQYYRHYGVSDTRIVFSPYSVDDKFFQQEEARLRPRRAEIRATLGVNDGRPILIACGKMYDYKQPILLLRAFQQLRRKFPCALVYVGDGAMRKDVEQVVREEQIPDVTVTGFVNQSRISEMYVSGDVLVLPSVVEQWGLVVNEAMYFGLPLVLSDKVGCGADLVRIGENGSIFDYQSTDALVDALTPLVVDRTLRESFGAVSREIITRYSLDRTADGVVKAFQLASKRHRHLVNVRPEEP